MKDTLLKVLSWVDTPTVCNAIEIAQGRQGFQGFTRKTVTCANKGGLPLIGFARTAKIAGNSESDAPLHMVQARRKEYFRYVSESPQTSIMVMEDADYPDCVGAFWGEVNSQIHQKFGLSGVLTNGVVRDLDGLPADFPIISGSVGLSQGFTQVIETGTPVRVFGLTVQEGDCVHADQHGAVVIPPDVLPNIEKAIAQSIEMESLLLGPLGKAEFTFEDLQNAWAKFEEMQLKSITI